MLSLIDANLEWFILITITYHIQLLTINLLLIINDLSLMQLFQHFVLIVLDVKEFKFMLQTISWWYLVEFILVNVFFLFLFLKVLDWCVVWIPFCIVHFYDVVSNVVLDIIYLTSFWFWSFRFFCFLRF